MIPKIIHYCWFGRKPLPPLAIKCIESWKKYLPDYEIKEWNEDNFNVYSIPYTQEAYQAKKYAFVSDYARFWILYNYGGLYFDTDVELIKPINDIIEQGDFWGCEGSLYNINTIAINPGVGIGCRVQHPFYKKILDYYATLHFFSSNNTTIVKYTTDIMKQYGWEQQNTIQKIYNMTIYPIDYFSPIDIITKKIIKTNNTRSIHWYTGSWEDFNLFKFTKKKIKQITPIKLQITYNKLKNFLLYYKM